MNYDRISEVYKGEIHSPVTQEIARNRIHWICSQATGKRVADLGCSQGIASILLGRKGFEVVGVDIQASGVDYALRDLAKESEATQAKVEFIVGDASSLPFVDGEFDTVLLGELLEHLAEPRAVLKEARRVLVSGGKLVVTTPFGLFPHHDHKQTFLAKPLTKMVSSMFAIASVSIVEGYFRLVAINEPGGPKPGDILTNLHDDMEMATLAIQRQLMESREKLEAQAERVARQREYSRKQAEDIERLQAILAEKDEGVISLQRVIDYQNHQSSLLSQQIDRLERERSKLQLRVAEAEWRLASVQARKVLKLGAALAAVRRRPWRVFILPFEVLRIVFMHSQLPPRPIAEGHPDVRSPSDEPASGGGPADLPRSDAARDSSS